MSAVGLCTPSRCDPKEMTATRPLLPGLSPPSAWLFKLSKLSAALALPVPVWALAADAYEPTVLCRVGDGGRGGMCGDLDDTDDLDLDDRDDLDDLDDDTDDDDPPQLQLPLLRLLDRLRLLLLLLL